MSAPNTQISTAAINALIEQYIFEGDGTDLDTTGWAEAYELRPAAYRTGDDIVDRWRWLAAARPEEEIIRATDVGELADIGLD